MKNALLGPLALAVVLLGGGVANGDEPLEPPTARKIVAKSGGCWAYTDPVTKTTIGYRRSKGRTIKLWELSGWFRVAALASDCDHFVTGYDGVNLLPEKFDPKTVMLSFYAKGKSIRQLALDELVSDLSKLRRTSSHWAWGNYLGVESGTRYRVETVDRGQLVFDMKTGVLIEK
jgi:hypothetical protein